MAQSDPENTRVFIELASCYEDQKHIPEALAVLSRYVQGARNPGRIVQRKIAELKELL